MNSNMSEEEDSISIYTKTWSRDSHGLYDYESSQTKTDQNYATSNRIVSRKKVDIKLHPRKENMNADDEFLLEVSYDEENQIFWLSNSVPDKTEPTEKNINELQNKIWFVIKHDEGNGTNNNTQNMINHNEDYYLCKNDIIKLGRVKYALNEMIIKTTEDTMKVDVESDPIECPYNISYVNYGTEPVFNFIYKTHTPQKNNEDITCKYCLSGGSNKENPLVKMCKCTGGIEFCHYKCLKAWMQTKLSIKDNQEKTVTSYNIKAFNCEICKTPYPCNFILF